MRSTTTAAEVYATPTDKPKRWDFSKDAASPGRLAAWGAELATATALVAPLAEIPWEVGAGAGLVCTGAAVMYERARGSWARVTATRAASWLATTGWLSYALAEGPSLLTMAFGGAIWAAGGAANIAMDGWGETTKAAEAELDRRVEEGEKIEEARTGLSKILYDVCGIDGVVVDPVVDKWANGVGETLKLTLPAHLNVEALRGSEAALAGVLGLPKGGGISFNSGGPSTPRNVVYMAVTRKNMMAGAIAYPSLEPTTINKKVGFGVVANGDEAGLNLKDEGFIAVGAQGTGKTGLMSTIALGVIRCVDAILIDIDSSAKMSAQWVNPWLLHGVGRPLVDWPATTADEARLVVKAAIDAIAARKTLYADLLEQEGVDNLPARKDIPAIVIRVDETKSMPSDVLHGLDIIIEEGRSVNIRVSGTGLRATRDYITATMDELTPGRVGLRTNNASELSMLFPDFSVDMSLFTDPGTVLYMSATKGPHEPTPAKVYATMAEVFPEGSEDRRRMASLHMDAARKLSPIRPQMDKITADAMGLAWEQRWARCIPNLRADARGTLDASRMHESVWELYQSWDTPASPDELLGRVADEDGNIVVPTGRSATIPSLSEDSFDIDELEKLAAEEVARQDAAIEQAKEVVKPLSSEALALKLFAAQNGPARPSEVYESMVRGGYDKSDRTFRDLCKSLAIKGELSRTADGRYEIPGRGEIESGAGLSGPEDDADGDSSGVRGRDDRGAEEGRTV